MKKIFICFVIITTVVFSTAATQEIDKMINDIKKPRQSLDMKELEQVKDPFIVAEMDTGASEIIIAKLKKPVPKFSLSAIINNKAHINGDWYEKGGTVLGYSLAHVGIRGVVLTFEKKIVKVFLPEKIHKNDEIIKIEGGK